MLICVLGDLTVKMAMQGNRLTKLPHCLKFSAKSEDQIVLSVSGQVAAMGLCFNTFTFVYYAVDGFGAAASTRVSHELGGSCPGAAQRATSIALGLGLMACCGWCGVLYLMQPTWTKLFTRDPVSP